MSPVQTCLRIALVLLCTIFGEHMSNIYSDIERKTSFICQCLNDLCDFENEVGVTQFEVGLRLALVLLCTTFGEDRSNISSDIERKPSCICRRLNDLCDLENEVKVTQFKLGLCLALVLLCTIFVEDKSNISSDFGQKPSFICRRLNDLCDLGNEFKVTQFELEPL